MFSSFACACTYQCLNLFTLVQFHTVTMPGEEVAKPPAKIPDLPFILPSFDWNAGNLYCQFKLFKMKVEFAFKGTYAKNPGHAKVGATLNWLGDAAFENMVTSYGLPPPTKMIL